MLNLYPRIKGRGGRYVGLYVPLIILDSNHPYYQFSNSDNYADEIYHEQKGKEFAVGTKGSNMLWTERDFII